ncbi:hypothetical protein [Shewanella sp. OMA3-2]|uniref:hypothetical protein n=1 Tax=Shewanella sp. OMA3-2 TaxID=2908650 RepID=UPI001F1EE47E|nr:hypothetical protein [Shewanella sp. OMA3-2]UJF21656.1 hypothetical protein L0B17_16600 [Shewanella sp. OMA3-2]
MDGIFCGYYDEEIDQDVPMQPTLDEALLLFKKFHWENEKTQSAMKVLMLQIPDDASMHVSCLEKNKWCITANVSNRRRFFGPFFKRDTFHIFIDKNAIETEELIRLFYRNTLSEFTDLLKSSSS